MAAKRTTPKPTNAPTVVQPVEPQGTLNGSTVTTTDINVAEPVVESAVAELIATEDAALVAAVVEQVTAPVPATPADTSTPISCTVLIIASNVCATYSSGVLVNYTTAPLDKDALYAYFKLTKGPGVIEVNVKPGTDAWNALVHGMVHNATPPANLIQVLGE